MKNWNFKDNDDIPLMWGCNVAVSWGQCWGGGPASSGTCISMSGPLGELGGDESQDDEDVWCAWFTNGLLWMHWWLVSPARLVNWRPHVHRECYASWLFVAWWVDGTLQKIDEYAQTSCFVDRSKWGLWKACPIKNLLENKQGTHLHR